MRIELLPAVQTGEIGDRHLNQHKLYRFPQTREARGPLIEPLSYLTACGFMRSEIDDSLRQDVAGHILGSQRLLVTVFNDQITAFLATTVRKGPLNESLYHIEGIIVDPGFEHTGLARRIIVADTQITETTHIACHTQSKNMEHLIKRVADCSIDNAKYFAPSLPNHQLSGNIDRGRYGDASLYGNMLHFAPLAITAPDFDVNKGDAMIFAGPIKSEFRNTIENMTRRDNDAILVRGAGIW